MPCPNVRPVPPLGALRMPDPPPRSSIEPTFHLRFAQEGLAPREFFPLAPRGQLHVDVAELSNLVPEEVTADLLLHLEPGTWDVPLLPDEPFPVEVPDHCRCSLHLSTGPVEHEATMVRALTLSFDPPILLHNILPVLGGLPQVFQDRQWEALKARFEASGVRRFAGMGFRTFRGRLRPGLKHRLAGARDRLETLVKDTAGRASTVVLREVSGSPILHEGGWLLEFRFSGHVRTFAEGDVPFSHVRVPRFLIPFPHALLGRLLSDDPLVTARIRRDHLKPREMSRLFASILKAFEGEVTLRGALAVPELCVSQLDGGQITLRTRLPGTFEIRSRLEGRAKQEAIEVEMKSARVVEVGSVAGAEPDAFGKLIFDTSLSLVPAKVAEGCPASFGMLGELLGRLGSGAADRVHGSLRVHGGSKLRLAEVEGRWEHPLLRGVTFVHADLHDLGLDGDVDFTLGPNPERKHPARVDVTFRARAAVRDGSGFDDGTTRVALAMESADITGRLLTSAEGDVVLNTRGSSAFEARISTDVGLFPELAIDDGRLLSRVKGKASLDGRLGLRTHGSDSLEADFAGTRLDTTLSEAYAELPGRSLALPEGSTLRLSLSDAVLATTGLGRASIDVDWDFLGASPLLRHAGKAVEIFVSELRRGSFTLHLSATGGLTISGPKRGLYDAHYFNALINPASELHRWLQILEDDEAVDHVIASIRVFSEDGARILEQLRKLAHRLQNALHAEGIDELGDLIPGRRIARLISRILVDSTEIEARILPLVQQVTDARGLDVTSVKRLFEDTLPTHRFGFELDRLVRWAAILLTPTDPIPPHRPLSLSSLCDEPRYQSEYRHVPDAASMYRVVSATGPLPEGWSTLLARIAPYLKLTQVEWILSQRGPGDWIPDDLSRIRYVAELKSRIRSIAEGYGGLGFAPQALAIGFFLPEPVAITRAGADAGAAARFGSDFPVPYCLLGPEDAAVLVQAGLASAIQTRTVQLNLRLLLDMTATLPPSYLSAVLVELSGQSAWVLAGVLNALLGLHQDSLQRPIDMVRFLGERLSIDFPDIDDYMAGGRWARLSYFEALSRVAEQLLATAEPYRALKARLQNARHPPPPIFLEDDATRSHLRAAEQAIALADEAGARCAFRGRGAALRTRARKAYEEAFEACRHLLEANPHAFQLPFFKAFWARNHEALVVLSVLRNVQEDIDQTRRWLQVRSGKPIPRDEQTLLETVVEVLYLEPQDRVRLLADPLVRLLIDPPPGHYDFTVVSCMGVVTEGVRGTELEESYQRLSERRGVSVVRADTATARSLSYNAERVEAAIRRVKTPWGYVGYSQGCTNALQTECNLISGTPEQQAHMQGFRTRNLLFSAANGSAHGTCSNIKFLHAMIEADHFLSAYQALYSRRAIEIALYAIRLFLDSRVFVQGMWGVDSLSHDGVLALGREGQYEASAPTSTVRGVVSEEILPEALEFLAHVLTAQIENDRHDTQVAVDEAMGFPVFVRNAAADVLRRCDMGSLPQITHHWSPLLRETAFITTDRDRERAVYAFPKDRHVFPWIEVNARFGVIRHVPSPARDEGTDLGAVDRASRGLRR
jgi:hypothetical protein